MSRGWFKVGGLMVLAAAALLLATSPSEARPRGWRGYGRAYYYDSYPGYYRGNYGYYPGAYYGYRGYYGYYGDGFYGDYGYRPRSYRYGYRWFGPTYYYESAPSSYGPGFSTGGYYGAFDESTSTGEANGARLTVQVPADAEIWVEGQRMSQMGESRIFVSPALTPGKEFTYDIRARWMENGKEMSVNKQVKVHAGGQATVDMRQASATEEKVGEPAEGRPADRQHRRDRFGRPQNAPPEGRKAPNDRRNLPGTPAPEEATPSDKKETTPLDKKEANPLDKKETIPSDKKEANPLDKKETAPLDKKETPPSDKKEANPLDKKETAPLDKKETIPSDKKEANPLDKKETIPPDKNNNTKPKDQAEPKP